MAPAGLASRASNVAQPGGGEVQGRLAVGECPDHTRTSPDLATARLLRERTPPCVTRAMYPASAIMRGAPRVSAGKRPADLTLYAEQVEHARRAWEEQSRSQPKEWTAYDCSLNLPSVRLYKPMEDKHGKGTIGEDARRARAGTSLTCRSARLRAHATVGCKCADRKHPLWQLSSPVVVKARDA
jgi:hypothetical protein